MTFIILETDRLFLNEIQLSDEADIYNLFSNRLVTEYYDLGAFATIEQAR